MNSSPGIVVVMGLPGSGKTYFAQHLARVLSAEPISSDQVRAEHRQRGRYELSDKLAVYQAMTEQAEVALADGQSVVLDATFHLRRFRRFVEEWAEGQGYPLRYIEIIADESTTLKRTRGHRPDSEADYEVYRQLKREAEPLEQVPLRLDSSEEDIDTMLQRALDYLTDDTSTP
ncbi:MAG: ATP-binding protein [Tunicatimonas sp.]